MAHDLVVRLAFLDVGQGDTIVISTPETGDAVIVDCADPDPVFKYLGNQNIKHLRGLIISHLHLDHYKGVVKLLNNCETRLGLKCEKVIFNWPHTTNPKHLRWLLHDSDHHSDWGYDEKSSARQRRTVHWELISWANEHDSDCYALDSNVPLPIRGSINQAIEILQPSHGQLEKLLEMGLNNTSGILKIHGKGSNALLTGDVESAGWQALQKRYPDLYSDVLQFPHHGAWKNANVDDLLDNVKPSIVVISVGTAGIKYDHPNAHVFSALSQRPHIRLLCTQATSQCDHHVLDKRESIIAKLKTNSVQSGFDIIVSKRGCPCAGTIVIELGSEACILQPEFDLHRKTVVKTHFRNHKCAV